jgi:fructan beta-fructosidase
MDRETLAIQRGRRMELKPQYKMQELVVSYLQRNGGDVKRQRRTFHKAAAGGCVLVGGKLAECSAPYVRTFNDDENYMNLRSLTLILLTLTCDLEESSNAAEPRNTTTLTNRYLLFPIQTGAPSKRIALQIDGRTVREFDAELGTADANSFWAPLDAAAFNGKEAKLIVDNAEADFALLQQTDELPRTPDLYNEALRPQFHFSQRVGWNNDPNGLVYCDGEWHLFFQHNPYGWNWGNMHWGHAVSPDLVHWKELPIALYNREYGDWAFSGGAIVDEQNTAGWQIGDEKVIVVSYTSTGRGECIAYSNDRGRTFTEYQGNPVVQHKGRDPKIIWHGPTNRWVMAVYDEPQPNNQAIAFYSSPNLKEWRHESTLPGYFECPEIFELPVDGDPRNTRWVVFAADGKYALGAFDGRVFTPDHEGKHQLHYGAYYASQTFSNAPDGRRIQIGWAKVDMPGMPFNQTFSFPHELTLRTTTDGVRMFAEPVREIAKLYKKQHVVRDKPLASDEPVELEVEGELFDIEATFELGDAETVGIFFGGDGASYNSESERLMLAELEPEDGKVQMRVLVDRSTIEIIGNHGRVVFTLNRVHHRQIERISAYADAGKARLIELKVHELASIWNQDRN